MHDDTSALFRAVGDGQTWLFSSKATRSFWEATFQVDDWLIFGNETRGIDADVIRSRQDQALRVPQARDERCLNLSTTCGIALYEALRQISA
jgi:tRNA (cytidine/uridine-2'-O-)-methyltransferase